MGGTQGGLQHCHLLLLKNLRTASSSHRASSHKVLAREQDRDADTHPGQFLQLPLHRIELDHRGVHREVRLWLSGLIDNPLWLVQDPQVHLVQAVHQADLRLGLDPGGGRLGVDQAGVGIVEVKVEGNLPSPALDFHRPSAPEGGLVVLIVGLVLQSSRPGPEMDDVPLLVPVRGITT